MAIFTKYTVVKDPNTGQDIEFGQLSQADQQTILDADSAQTASEISGASTETAGDATNPSANASTQNTGTDSGSNSSATPLSEEEIQAQDNPPADNTDTVNPNEKPINPADPNAWDSEDSATFNPKSTGSMAGKLPSNMGGTLNAGQSIGTDSSGQGYVSSVNLLHQYPSYTYGLTLHALTPADYAQLVDNPKGWRPSLTLISSASRYKNSRSAYFKDDFYFEDLKISTVIAPTAETKATNGIDLSFTIIEPYGMTLIDRLLDFSQYEVRIQNYLEVPYVLEINFFAYTDSGQVLLNPLTKWFPINLREMKIRNSVKGTEYQVQATPYNHQAYTQNFQTIKSAVEVTAKTVGDYFNGNDTDTATTASAMDAYYAANPDKKRPGKVDPAKNTAKAPAPKSAQPVNDPPAVDVNGNTTGQTTADPAAAATDTTPTPITPTIKTNSLAAAYNAWQQAALEGGDQEVADSISFVIMDANINGLPPNAIKNAKVAFPNKTDVSKTPASSNDKAGTNANATNNDPKKSAKTPAAQGDTMNTQTFTINAGTSIVSVIDQVITNSEYITNQLVETETSTSTSDARSSAENLSKALGDKPVYWYKVVPKLEITKFDETRQTWGKHVTFYITPYLYYNGRDPRAAKSKLPHAVKDYQYFYTGKNRDIINFDIDFNALFFNAVLIDKKQKEVTAKYKGSADEDTTKSKSEKQVGYQNPAPTKKVLVAGSATSGGGAITKADTQNSQSFKDNLYTYVGGDMINLDVRIIGDPDFIKQDDVLFGPGTTGGDTGQGRVNGASGSLSMDSGQIFCNVSFKSPADIMPEGNPRGQLRYYGTESQAAFSGFYCIQTVDSEFHNGKFTQSLKMYRQPNQPGDGTSPTSASTTTGSSRLASINSDLKTLVLNGSSKVSGKSIDKALPDGKLADIVGGNKTPAWEEDFPTPKPDPTELTVDPTVEAGNSDDGLVAVVDGGSTEPIGDNSNTDGTLIV